MENNEEIWIFLSHSNADYEKVRLIRNLLEEQSLRPLMFFLKCLNDEDEIDSLIKREIDCRTKFILCDSPQARNSKWVQREVDYIKSKNQIYETIDLSLSEEELREKISLFKSRFVINIIYRGKDEAIVSLLEKKLRNLDFIINEINSIDKSPPKGHYLIILSDNFKNDKDFMSLSKSVYEIHKEKTSIFSLDMKASTSARSIGLNSLLLNNNNPSEVVDAIVCSILFSEMRDAYDKALKERNPEALYYQGLRLYNDDRSDYVPNPEITCRNIECAAYFCLREAAQKGHKSAKELISHGIWCYLTPEFIESQISEGATSPNDIDWSLYKPFM